MTVYTKRLTLLDNGLTACNWLSWGYLHVQWLKLRSDTMIEFEVAKTICSKRLTLLDNGTIYYLLLSNKTHLEAMRFHKSGFCWF